MARFVTLVWILLFMFNLLIAGTRPLNKKMHWSKRSVKISHVQQRLLPVEPTPQSKSLAPVATVAKERYPQVVKQTPNVTLIIADSSRNGYGWLNRGIHSIDRYPGNDALIVAFRDYVVGNEATGILGAIKVDAHNGLANGTIKTFSYLNADVAEGTIGARYPGAVAIDIPFVHYNQYLSGDAQTTPALSHPYLIAENNAYYGDYDYYGEDWDISQQMDKGYVHTKPDSNALWNGPVKVVHGIDGNYHYLGAYRDWVDFRYVLLNAYTDDPIWSDWVINTSPYIIDTTNILMLTVNVDMAEDGFAVAVGVGNEQNVLESYSDLKIMVMTSNDYGVTWTDPKELPFDDIGIPTSVTKEDSIWVPASEDPEDTTMVLYEGNILVGLPYISFLDVKTDTREDGKHNIYVAFDIIGGPWASDSTFYYNYKFCGPHIAVSEDDGATFSAHRVWYNNGFFVGDSTPPGVTSHIMLESEMDIAKDENGRLYALWLDRRGGSDVEAAETKRYNADYDDIYVKADVYLSVSDDNGKTWSEPINVTDTKSIDEYELNAARTASAANGGTLHFAYCTVDPFSSPFPGGEDIYIDRVNRVWIGEISGIVDAIEEVVPAQPHQFTLQQNYPNPFNPTTTISFTAHKTGLAKLEIFNTAGQKIATLFNQPVKQGQPYTVHFEAQDLASGIYFYQLTLNGKSQVRKMALIK